MTRPEARLLFASFTNALCIGLAIRAGFFCRKGVRFLLHGVLLNACLLSVFGIVQYASRTDKIYWTWERTRHFFAGFYYENHAGQFFYLMFALAVGIVAHQLCVRRVRLTRALLIRLTVLLVLTFLAAIFSLSRASILFVVILFISGAVHIARNLPGNVNAVTRFYLLAGVTAFCLLGLVLISGDVGKGLRDDSGRRRPGQTLVEQAYEARAWQWEAAVEIWKRYPVWGCGSGSYRYFLTYFIPPGSVEKLHPRYRESGQAHNDFLQFLAEWGLAGIVLLGALLTLLVKPLFKAAVYERGLLLFPVLGAGFVVAHSLFDLPFRSPAVLAAWVLTLCASGRYFALLKEA